jgi:outer membrane protein assembly factor BamB
MSIRVGKILSSAASLLVSLTLAACGTEPASGPVPWNKVSKSEVFPDLAWKFDDGLENQQISRFSPPTVVDGTAYFVVEPDHRDWNRSASDSVPNPFLVAVDDATGTIRWRTELIGIGLVGSAPIVQHGVVLVSTLGNMDPNHDVLAFDAQTGSALWKLENTFPAARGGNDEAFCTLQLKNNSAGETLQELDYLCVNWRSGAVVSELKLVETNGWWVASSGVAADQGGLYVFDGTTLTGYELSGGARKFQTLLPDGAYQLAAANGLVYANDDFVTAFDAETGEKRWRLAQKVGRAQVMLAPGDNTLFVIPEAKLSPALLAIDGQTGAVQWSLDTGADLGYAHSPQIIGETIYLAFGDSVQLQDEFLPAYGKQGVQVLYAVNRKSGQVRWRYEQPDFKTELKNTSRITLPIAELNGIVYLTAWLSCGGGGYACLYSSTLFRLEAASGKVLSTTTLLLTKGSDSYSHIGDLLTGAYAVNGRLYLPTGANRVFVLK